MRIIAITTPRVTPNDVPIIRRLLDGGIDIVHLRKPESDIDACRGILAALSAEHRARIVIHDYPELYDEFSLMGIHINHKVATLPEGYRGSRSRSCHTFEEVVRYKGEYDYLFLSPIFDSISKSGYGSAFDDEALRSASQCGIIDERVIALGGVTPDKIAYLEGLHFGGVAMLGAIYK
jgi:thiamine-phosphate pyrophosphorylase